MDFKKLQVFKMSIEMGSLSKAADCLHYTQPAITKMMNSLESEIGIRLLERTPSGICLTDEGIAIMPLVNQILDLGNEIKKIAAEVPSSAHADTVF